MVSSARVGMAKPDRRIYEVAGAVPERCLFVDDRLENVEAARSLGMSGVHYQTVADLAAALTWWRLVACRFPLRPRSRSSPSPVMRTSSVPR
ncbi:HAD-IA family hydrolase [Nonomuraea sp. B19D2]|uniref:HAD-IA family hydrolase n=1 Tax=Nonomuraea sp. B19D2 TaxID=3159561 RepID=UPI0032DA30C3